MPRSTVTHLDLHCLLRPVCPNTYGTVYTEQKQSQHEVEYSGLDYSKCYNIICFTGSRMCDNGNLNSHVRIETDKDSVKTGESFEIRCIGRNSLISCYILNRYIK